jgi:hypothetical protein
LALRYLQRNRLRQRTSEEFVEWVDARAFAPKTEHDTKKCYEAFRVIYFGDDPTFKQRTFTNYIKFYAESRGWKVADDQAIAEYEDEMAKYDREDAEALKKQIEEAGGKVNFK